MLNNMPKPIKNAALLLRRPTKLTLSVLILKRVGALTFTHEFSFLLFLAMNEFKDQLDATEKEKVSKLVTELRELAAKGQTGDASVTADTIREKISETQTASLGLFQKVYEKRAAEQSSSSSESAEQPKEDKKD